MALILEGQQFMGNACIVKRFTYGVYILRGHMGILHALDDEQSAFDLLDVMDR